MQRDSLHDAKQVTQSYLKAYKKPLALAVMLLSGLFTTTEFTGAHAALSATTANTIQGTKPYLLLSDGVTKLTNLDELLGFSMWDGTYEADGVTKHMVQVDASMAGTALTASAGMTYNDVVTLVLADNSLQNVAGVTVGDDDGDALLPGSGSVTGQMRATWKNGGVVVPPSDLGQTLSLCGGPYTLTIAVPTAVNASTSYGDPNTRGYGTSTGVTYTFIPNDMAICYLQPEMTVYLNGNGPLGTGVVKFASGYNSSVWEYDSVTNRHKGFSVSKMSLAGVHFPTVGFEGAWFSVIGSGNDQSKYRCSSPDDGGKITLSGTASLALGAKCKVTYNSATKSAFTAGGTPTITMEYNTGGSTWVVIDSYSIATPSKWAIGAGPKLYSNDASLSASTSFPALDACRVVVDGSASPATTPAQALDMTVSGKAWRQKYLYRRDELTNSPYADRGTYPELSAQPYSDNYFSRDVDGTFMGEWGEIYNYADSGWVTELAYWTAEAWSTDYQFITVGVGYVFNPDHSDADFTTAICRGE